MAFFVRKNRILTYGNKPLRLGSGEEYDMVEAK